MTSIARAARRDSGEVLPADPAMLIHPAVQPKEGEPVIAKHRTSAFSGSAFEMILRAHNIATLILMGHATSGVILSTVRLAADLDYHLIVVEDGCADRDPEVHRLLMEKVFPRQCTVVSSKDMVEALAALSGV
jgi:nicotinamidase-related amidase